MWSKVKMVELTCTMALLLATLSAPAGAKAFKVCADPNNPPLSDQNGGGLENKSAGGGSPLAKAEAILETIAGGPHLPS